MQFFLFAKQIKSMTNFFLAEKERKKVERREKKRENRMLIAINFLDCAEFQRLLLDWFLISISTWNLRLRPRKVMQASQMTSAFTSSTQSFCHKPAQQCQWQTSAVTAAWQKTTSLVMAYERDRHHC